MATSKNATSTDASLIEDAELYTCANLLSAVSDQLQAQMDVNSEYMLLQRQLERAHNHSIELLEGVTRRTQNMEKRWQESVQETVQIRQQILDEITQAQKKDLATHSVHKADSDATKNEVLNKHAHLRKAVDEVREITEVTEGVHAKAAFDRRRLSHLESKAEEVALLNKEISRKLDHELQIAEQIKQTTRQGERTYGICELTTGYKQLLRNLSSAVDILESLKAKSTDIATPVPTLTVDELDQLLGTLRKLIKMLKFEVGNAAKTTP